MLRGGGGPCGRQRGAAAPLDSLAVCKQRAEGCTGGPTLRTPPMAAPLGLEWPGALVQRSMLRGDGDEGAARRPAATALCPPAAAVARQFSCAEPAFEHASSPTALQQHLRQPHKQEVVVTDEVACWQQASASLGPAVGSTQDEHALLARFLCLRCSRPRSASPSRRSWRKRLARTAPSPRGCASGPTTPSGETRRLPAAFSPAFSRVIGCACAQG